jgi:hypothetical protein
MKETFTVYAESGVDAPYTVRVSALRLVDRTAVPTDYMPRDRPVHLTTGGRWVVAAETFERAA